jgi:hypothetical protein
MDWTLHDSIAESNEVFTLITDLTRLADQLAHEILSLPSQGTNGASWPLAKARQSAIDVQEFLATLQMVSAIIQPTGSLQDLRERRHLVCMVRASIRLARALQKLRGSELGAERRAEFAHLASRLIGVAQPLFQMLCPRRKWV